MAQINCIKTNSFEMEYIKMGNGKRAFVMIPGISIKSVIPSADNIETAYSQFLNDYTIYLFDRKKDITDDYSIEDMANDTAIAINNLGLKEVYLFGASMGGMISQAIAINHPKLVKALIIGSSAARISEPSKDVLNSWISIAQKGDIKALSIKMIYDIYSEQTIKQYADVLVNANLDATERELDAFIISARQVTLFDAYDRLSSLNVPTLVIGSNEDKVLTANASLEIAQKLGCEIYMYDGFSHAVYDEAPDYKDKIEAFFAKY